MTVQTDDANTGRLAGALFLMALGYALLSVCLYRVLAFSGNCTPFFMLDVYLGMSVGACLAKRRMGNSLRSLRRAIWGLIPLAIALPLMGALGAGGPDIYSEPLITGRLPIRLVWLRVIYQIMITAPLFVFWGMAEFTGYELALGSRKLRRWFYVLFVWALALAVLIGSWAIPRIGWLRTLALVPFAAMLSAETLGGQPWFRGKRRILAYLAALVCLYGVGTLDGVFTNQLYTGGIQRVGSALQGRYFQNDEVLDPPARATIVEQAWGKYCHLTFLKYERNGTTDVVGYYDGCYLWEVRPNRQYDMDYERVTFRLIPQGADICILGAGGGAQVCLALERNPRSVVAVDIVPELFTLLKGRCAWANGNIYLSPEVETVVADGRHYIKETNRKFDFILLPHTESGSALLRSAFEPGQSIHSVEAFKIMREKLKPDGILAIFKGVDVDQLLFRRYARTLKAAGLHPVGWVQRMPNWRPGEVHKHLFILLATLEPRRIQFDEVGRAVLSRDHWHFEDLSAEPAGGDVLRDDSPWLAGTLATLLSEDDARHVFFQQIALVLSVGIVLAVFVLGSARGRQSLYRTGAFVLAGAAVGANAIYLENAIIFYLIRNLLNPLAAFFVGASAFLLIWGISSLGLKRWTWVVFIGILGCAGALLTRRWYSSTNLLSLGLMALGGGLFFPLLAIRFRKGLLRLFVTDALGSLIGGAFGIWLPLLYGFKTYFDYVPYVWIVALVFVALAVRADSD